jgi:MarR-like DNA-binding transcriptional regulator SgrR of sgrS sRNA
MKLLVAEHWYFSVARAIKKGRGIHFDPKRDLVGGLEAVDGFCEGLSSSDNSVTLRLKEPNKLYKRLLGRIEASVLPLTRENRNDQCHPFRTAGAGPYVFHGMEKNKISMRINENFPGHKNRIAAPQINILAVPDEEAFELRIKGEVDFIFPRYNPPTEIREKLLSRSQLYQESGYVVFISFRARASSRNNVSEWTQSPKYRTALAALTRNIPPLYGYEKTSSLLLGKGMGRLQDFPSFNEALPANKLPPISLAAVQSRANEAIIDYLQRAGVRAEIFWVKQTNDLFTGKAGDTDAFICSYDFIGHDPYVSFYTTLNPERPLILDDGKFRSELQEIQNIEDESQKDAAYQKLHYRILESAAAIPIFLSWQEYFAAKELNLRDMKGFALWTIEKNS